MDMDTLEKIYEILAQVADLQYAIEAGEGDVVMHWQRIGKIDHRLRRLARALPDDLFYQLPSFAKFSLTTEPINGCWSECRQEVETVLVGSSDS